MSKRRFVLIAGDCIVSMNNVERCWEDTTKNALTVEFPDGERQNTLSVSLQKVGVPYVVGWMNPETDTEDVNAFTQGLIDFAKKYNVSKENVGTENYDDAIPISKIYEISPKLDVKKGEVNLGIEVRCEEKNLGGYRFKFFETKWNKNDLFRITQRLNQLKDDNVTTYSFTQVCEDVGAPWGDD